MLGNKIITQLAPNTATRIVKNITMVVPLKDLIKFWKSPKKLLINCKVEVKLQNILFFLKVVMIMLVMILIILFLIQRTQSYMSLS